MYTGVRTVFLCRVQHPVRPGGVGLRLCPDLKLRVGMSYHRRGHVPPGMNSHLQHPSHIMMVLPMTASESLAGCLRLQDSGRYPWGRAVLEPGP